MLCPEHNWHGEISDLVSFPDWQLHWTNWYLGTKLKVMFNLTATRLLPAPQIEDKFQWSKGYFSITRCTTKHPNLLWIHIGWAWASSKLVVELADHNLCLHRKIWCSNITLHFQMAWTDSCILNCFMLSSCRSAIPTDLLLLVHIEQEFNTHLQIHVVLKTSPQGKFGAHYLQQVQHSSNCTLRLW